MFIIVPASENPRLPPRTNANYKRIRNAFLPKTRRKKNKSNEIKKKNFGVICYGSAIGQPSSQHHVALRDLKALNYRRLLFSWIIDSNAIQSLFFIFISTFGHPINELKPKVINWTGNCGCSVFVCDHTLYMLKCEHIFVALLVEFQITKKYWFRVFGWPGPLNIGPRHDAMVKTYSYLLNILFGRSYSRICVCPKFATDEMLITENSVQRV